jgi:uncharacterized membrane protein
MGDHVTWLKKPGFVLTVLFLSLGLNCVGLGLLMSPAVQFLLRDHPVLDQIRHVMASVPPEMRKAMREQMESHHDEMRAARKDLRTTRQEIAVLIQQPQLDEAALRTKLAVVREKTAAMQAVVQDSFVAVLKNLPAAEREKHVKDILRKIQPGLESSTFPPRERPSADDEAVVHAPDKANSPSSSPLPGDHQ